ncbi:MFS transporter [Mycobacterium avium subsp. hominissuis]|nr:major facilitator transporter [Mycobacterium avium subsp. hominissuis A5]KDP01600.1 major facilitator transporter [Mycobacterium avium subsp. hominissuis 101]
MAAPQSSVASGGDDAVRGGIGALTAMAATLPAPAPAGLADGHPLDESAEQQRRRLRIVVAASLLGTTVEWYDFFLYATAAGLVFNKVFFPNESSLVGTLLAFATFAVGFVMRPIGGLVFGHIGDRIGRKRSLALTMLIMGGATALIGVLPTAAQIGAWAPVLLLVLRVLQGFALGGEWGGAVLLAVEHSPGDRRGRYGAVPQVGLALGLALGTGIFAFLQIVLGPARFLSYGWRIGFLLSVLLVAIGIVVRLRVEETPAFRELQDLQAASTVPIRDILRERRSRRNTVLGLLSRWAEGSAFNTWGVFAISYATGALGLNRVSVLIAVTIAALLMAVLLPVSGVLTDRFGARRVYLAGIACYGLAAFPAFALFGTKKLLWFGLAMVIVFGVVHALFYGAQGTLYSALYPTNTRYTGLSFVYQFSGVYASGVTPMILTALIAALGGAPWLACGYLVATAVISVLATALIRDRDLYL